ncbi:hypothetical protein BGZ65_002654, partial [Modicella reniformis]
LLDELKMIMGYVIIDDDEELEEDAAMMYALVEESRHVLPHIIRERQTSFKTFSLVSRDFQGNKGWRDDTVSDGIPEWLGLQVHPT